MLVTRFVTLFLVFSLLLLISLPLLFTSSQIRLTARERVRETPTEGSSGLFHVPYNPLIALYALHLCKATYCVPDTLNESQSIPPESPAAILRNSPSLKQQLGFQLYNVYMNSSFGTLAYTGVDHVNQRVLAAFRGSTNLNNWLSDLTFWTEHYPCPGDDSNSSSSSSSSSSSGDDGDECDEEPNYYDDGHISASAETCADQMDFMTEPGECRVHQGFYRAYHSISHNLTSDLLQLHSEYPSYSFLVTGHSLGGAMAYLCALDLVTNPTYLASAAAFQAPFEVYTFGEPRPGNQPLNEYATTLLEGHPNGNRKHFRLTHGRDPVPHLPPMSFGYIHQPQELWYYRNGTDDDNPYVFAYCNGNATHEDAMCSNSIWSTTVSDHLLYLGTCTRCLCTQEHMEEELSSLSLPLEWELLIWYDNEVQRRQSKGS